VNTHSVQKSTPSRQRRPRRLPPLVKASFHLVLQLSVLATVVALAWMGKLEGQALAGLLGMLLGQRIGRSEKGGAR
jgi:hypothetical protein